MTDIFDPGSPGYNQPNPPNQTEEQSTSNDGSLNVAEEARKVADSNTSPMPLESDPVAKAESFEQKRKTELEEAQELHRRARSGADVNEEK